MSKFTILSPAYPPEKCYLYEVLLWRAFGRFPEMAWGDGEEDWRFESDAIDSYKAPIPSGEELSPEECDFAGIPNDPRMTNLLSKNFVTNSEFYRNIISKSGAGETLDTDYLKEIGLNLKEAIKQEQEEADWLPQYQDYVDEFQNEIVLDLRRGTLKMYGSKIPKFNNKSDCNSNNWKVLLEDMYLLESLDVVKIPQENWISKYINWNNSTCFTRNQKFIWIHVQTSEILKIYQPELLLKQKQVYHIGQNYAVTSAAISGRSSHRSLGGRPQLPWALFHVQVAKMYRDGEMPVKKEAAIAELQSWFEKIIGKPVSRSAIGQKLKPYFDTLQQRQKP